MKFFQTVRKQFAVVGISSTSDQSTQKYPYNEKVLLTFLTYGCTLVSQTVYIFCVASGFMEYMECVSALFAGTIIFVCFAAIVFKKRTLFESIDDIEKLIDSSKANSIPP